MNCLNFFATENKHEYNKKEYQNKSFCNFVMPSGGTKILEFNLSKI